MMSDMEYDTTIKSYLMQAQRIMSKTEDMSAEWFLDWIYNTKELIRFEQKAKGRTDAEVDDILFGIMVLYSKVRTDGWGW